MAGERAERENPQPEIVTHVTRAESMPDEPVAPREERASAPWEPAVRVGLNVGLVLAALNVVNWLAQLDVGGVLSNGQTTGVVAVPFCGLSFFILFGPFLARFVLFYIAGWRAEKRTGMVTRGAVAGMVAGVVDGASGLLVTLLGIALYPEYTLTSGFASAARPVGEVLLFSLLEVVALASVGLIIGGIGGGAAVANEYPVPTTRHTQSARREW